VYSNSVFGKLKLKIYLKLVCRLFDGFIVITNALKKYFETNVSTSKKIYILPILVEPERFSIQRNTSIEYIAYCGSMQGEKDGVSILIESFAKIANDFPKLELHLIGETKFNGIELLRNKITELKISQKVKFTGRVERDDLPSHLCNAKILALARPANKQAEGGFPTKLGEYLATGIAVVVTGVGEIPEYLIHNENAYMAIPNNVDDFAEKLKMALLNDDLSERIGRKGKELANTTFNYKEQGEKLVNWLNSEMLNIKK